MPNLELPPTPDTGIGRITITMSPEMERDSDIKSQ